MSKIYVNTGVVPTDVASTKRYMQDIKKVDLLTREQELELALRCQAGDETAIKKMMEHNLRFAVQVAKQYQGMGVLLEDLISCANIGLYEAATRFNPARKVKFITFAVWYIRSEIQKELNDNGRTVRIPSHKTQTEEYSTKSIHNPVGESETGETYADRFLPAEDEPSNSDLRDLKDLLEVAIMKLKKNEAVAVKMRYGIGIDYPKCMEDIAEGLGVTPERARQLVRSGEKALKEVSGIELLRKYL